MSTQQHLARIGAVAAVSGALAILITTLLHPLAADPNGAAAAFVGSDSPSQPSASQCFSASG